MPFFKRQLESSYGSPSRIRFSPEPKKNDTGQTEMAQPEMETTPSAIPAEDTQKVAQDNHPEPVVKIKDVEPRQEETLSAFEQELQKAHDRDIERAHGTRGAQNDCGNAPSR
ncbi:unnamed protein product [Cylindrotheca closterium]|uniref:Uncharacterized protein n=1 Tax=Cylindrotheca closterium TaxID=2856 RepID=A0AAD2FD48_9STRA|nr:unnamed protein product [Cylindrotheca closterium]CAJ1968060.1 unnamed protein product [Cylindrotheca closterium]